MDSLQPADLRTDDTVIDYCFGENFEKKCFTSPRVVGFDADNTAGGEEWAPASVRPHPCFIAFFSPLYAAACLELHRLHHHHACSSDAEPSTSVARSRLRTKPRRATRREAADAEERVTLQQLQARPPPARLVTVAAALLQQHRSEHASRIGDDSGHAGCESKCPAPAALALSAETDASEVILVALHYSRDAATDNQGPLLIRAPFWPDSEPESASAHPHSTGSTYVLRCESGGVQCALSVTRHSPLAGLWVIRMRAMYADPATTAACAREFTASESTVRNLAALTHVRLLD